ncbi:winged helix-turn-helix transcriptional regulator [Leifsonia sp. ZF2019]|nr:winged helix-turn-helix transcriptional regulator [Leifsonia sp. ZF2019]
MDTSLSTLNGFGFTDGVLPSACPTRIVLNHVTSTWGVLVLVALSQSDLRWGELRRTVQGISEKMLAQTLRTLEADGFVLRTAQPTIPPRVDYSLTSRGHELTEHLLPLMTWIAANADDILADEPVTAPTPLGLATGQASTTGDFRDGNEDSLYASAWSAFVADGVGGHAAGEVASATVAIRLASILDATRGRVPSEERLRELIAIANADLGLRVRVDPALAGMATTLVGLFADGTHLRVAHTGDSRAYRLRSGRLEPRTQDDSLVAELVASGALSDDDARSHPLRSVVTHVLGGAPEDAAALHISVEAARRGDRWLLASDGLTDYVTVEAITATLASGSPQDAADALLELARAHETRDNVSVIVADVVEYPEDPAYAPVFGGSAADDPASSREL